MYAIAKQYCIYHGVCLVGDVIQADKLPNEYFLKVEGKPPLSNVVTRGMRRAQVAAHDLPFDRRKVNSAIDDFTVLYFTGQEGNVTKLGKTEFWSITVVGGKTATIKVLNVNAARKLHDKLPQKVMDRNYLFDSVAYRRQVKQINKSNSDLKAERESDEGNKSNAVGTLNGRPLSKI